MDARSVIFRGAGAVGITLIAIVATLYLALVFAPDLEPASADCTHYAQSAWAAALATACIAAAVGFVMHRLSAFTHRSWIITVVVCQVLVSLFLLRAGLLDSSGPGSSAFHNRSCPAYIQLAQWQLPLG